VTRAERVRLVIVRTHTYTHAGPTAPLGPLKRTVKCEIKATGYNSETGNVRADAISRLANHRVHSRTSANEIIYTERAT